MGPEPAQRPLVLGRSVEQGRERKSVRYCVLFCFRRKEEEEIKTEKEEKKVIPRALRLEHRPQRPHCALEPARRGVRLHARAEDVEGLHADRDHGAGDAACLFFILFLEVMRGALEERALIVGRRSSGTD